MEVHRALAGRWKGEYAYDDSGLVPGSSGFAWDLKLGFWKRVRGTSHEPQSDRRATLRGKLSGAWLELWKVYADDPRQLRVLLPDGSRGSAIQLLETDEWANHVESLSLTYQQSRSVVIETLAGEITGAARAIRYAGEFVSVDRLEGTWKIRPATIAWAGLELPETKGTWWAVRSA